MPASPDKSKYILAEDREPSTPMKTPKKKASKIYTNEVSCPLCFQYVSEDSLDEHMVECLELKNLLKSSGVACLTPTAKTRPYLTSPIFHRDYTSYYGDAFLFTTTSPDQQRRDEQVARQLYLNELKECKENKEGSFVACDSCGKSLTIEDAYFMEACIHVFCSDCLRVKILSYLDTSEHDSASDEELCIMCPAQGCIESITTSIITSVMTDKENERLMDISLKRALKANEFVNCPTCAYVVERVLKNREEIIEELKKQKKSITESEMHKEQYRFRCPSCSSDFCSECKTTPYHEGFTCHGYYEFQTAKKCRFCEDVLDVNSTTDVCDSQECHEKKKIACNHSHSCGHLCGGIKNELQHLKCLNCAGEDDAQHGSDFCNICYITSLDQGPCIELKCGHIFHYQCVQKKIEQRWNGARLTFNFEKCPLCNTVIEHPALKELLTPIQNLRKKVERKCLIRMEQEGLLSIDEITKPQGKYFRKPLEYGMNTFAYYLCYVCGEPYFGGRVQCEQNNNGNALDFDEKELICGACCCKQAQNKSHCEKHGSDFIEYKCKFCCNIATWFCWGTTHFCDRCHRKQVENQSLTKAPRSHLPKCLGVGKCPIGGNHKENGEECVLGCSICRISWNNKQ